MMWYMIWFIAAAAAAGFAWRLYEKLASAVTGAVVGAVLMLIPSAISQSALTYDAAKLEHSSELVSRKSSQRDQLAAIVREELSADKYAALMAATPDADILVLLGTQVTPLLVERARLLVELNADLFALENKLEQDRIELCAQVENPFMPRVSGLPGCPEPLMVEVGA